MTILRGQRTVRHSRLKFRPFLAAAVVGAVFLSVTCISKAFADPVADSSEARIRSLLEAHDQSIKSVTFSCTFRVLTGATPSLQSGLEGAFAAAPEERTGRLHKVGNKIRVTVDEKFDDVRSSGLRVYCPIPAPDSFETAVIHRLPEGDTISYSGAGRTPLHLFLPMYFGLHASCGPLQLLSADPADPRVARISSDIDDDHTEVVVRYRDDQVEETKRIVFLAGDHGLAISEFQLSVKPHNAATPSFQAAGVATDHVPAGGGLVPRRTRTVFSVPGESVSGEANPLRLREWVADDVDLAPAAPASFVLELPETVVVTGLRRNPIPGPSRKIDLSAIDPRDVMDPPAQDQAAAGGVTLSRIVAVVLFNAVLGAIWLFVAVRGTAGIRVLTAHVFGKQKYAPQTPDMNESDVAELLVAAECAPSSGTAAPQE